VENAGMAAIRPTKINLFTKVNGSPKSFGSENGAFQQSRL